MGKPRECVWAVWLKDSLSQPAPRLCPCSLFLTHSPGVWHRAEGTPRKGGLKWGPRAIWGAFWGESRGGGCDISLQKSENKLVLKTLRLHPVPRGRAPFLQTTCTLYQRLFGDKQLHPHAKLQRRERRAAEPEGEESSQDSTGPTYFPFPYACSVGFQLGCPKVFCCPELAKAWLKMLHLPVPTAMLQLKRHSRFWELETGSGKI